MRHFIRPLERLRRSRSGTVAVLAVAMFSGIILALGVSIDLLMVFQARRQAQHAIDEATLSAARSSGQQYQSVGQSMFKAVLFGRNTEILSSSFNPHDDVLDGVAQVLPRTIFLRALGFDVIVVTVQASATLPQLEEATPVCFSVNGDVSIDPQAVMVAPGCAVAATGNIDINGANTDIETTCASGVCSYGDPFADNVGTWLSGATAALGCDAGPAVSTDFYTNRRFCAPVIVPDGMSLGFYSDEFYFEGGLEILSGGFVDAWRYKTYETSIVIGPNASLDLRAGGGLQVAAMQTGLLTGLALTAPPDQAGGVGSGIDLDLNGGALEIQGVIYAPNHDITVRGPGRLGVIGGELAIFAKSFTVIGAAEIHASPTTLGPSLPEIATQTVNIAPRLVR